VALRGEDRPRRNADLPVAREIQFIDEVRRRLPFRILVIQTDNGAEFQSHFHWHLEDLDIQHAYIRPRTPHLNGKVERSHRVDDQEFYQLLDRDGVTDDIHLFNTKLREWEDYCNYHRPHGALDGQTPYERLLASPRGIHSVADCYNRNPMSTSRAWTDSLHKAGFDAGLIEANLRLSLEERVLKHQAALDLAIGLATCRSTIRGRPEATARATGRR
jgi:hypothetical protein